MDSKTLKHITAQAGPIGDLITSSVNLNGVMPTEKLTPKMARRTARMAFGHSSGVTVWDNDFGYGYRLYGKSARKIH